MIKDLRQTGVHLRKYLLPKGRFKTTQYIDFQCTTEEVESTIMMSIVASYCLDDNTTGNTILKVPCSTNIEFTTDTEMTIQDLMPLWKNAVKNLRDECNKTKEPLLKDIPYPTNDQVKYDIEEFLKTWIKKN